MNIPLELTKAPIVETPRPQEIITVKEASPIHTVELPQISAKAVFFSRQGHTKNTMLDMMSIHTANDGILFTVADGHRGRYAAETTVDEFPSIFASSTTTSPSLESSQEALSILHGRIQRMRGEKKIDGAAIGAVFITKNLEDPNTKKAYGITPSDVEAEVIIGQDGLSQMLSEPNRYVPITRIIKDHTVNVINPVGDEDQVITPEILAKNIGQTTVYPHDVLIMHTDGLTLSAKQIVKEIISKRELVTDILRKNPSSKTFAKKIAQQSYASDGSRAAFTQLITDLLQSPEFEHIQSATSKSTPLELAIHVCQYYINTLHGGRRLQERGPADDVLLLAVEFN